MGLEENKVVVRRFVEEVQSQHRLDLVDELFDPDYIDHAVPAGMPPAQGTGYFKQFYTMMLQAFPNVHATIHDQIAEGDKVTTRKTFRGTHQGEFMGIPPTGKDIELLVIDVFRVNSSKLVEHWGAWDRLSMLEQLGAMPPPKGKG
jgi:steroid delta-isomerase-like uncharacterized protein